MSDIEFSDEDSQANQHNGKTEEQLCNQYFHSKPKQVKVENETLREFGTILSVVGNNGVIQALPSFDMIIEATVICYYQSKQYVGEIFDLMGSTLNPLYIARFEDTVFVGAQVMIDLSTIKKCHITE